MGALDLARWQFAITTVYHFFFVPLTLGTVWLVAGFQVAWVRTNNEKYLKLTKFFGKLFLINFAMGVVTGIVQEFQFGMNWSEYSRFVGDVFGAPLAMEALLAFFLESTFLGLWIFGWDRLPKKVHLATIIAAATGTMLSAYFILAANAWMQHPVGYEIDPVTGRAVLNDIGAVLFQNTAWVAFVHTMASSFLVAGAGVAAVAAYHMGKGKMVDVYRAAAKTGAWTVLVAAVVVSVSGDLDMKIMVEQQPMKVAAAEAHFETDTNVPFSILSVGDLSGNNVKDLIAVPGLLSFLATNDWQGEVAGVDNLQATFEQQYPMEQFGISNFVPYVPITYWGFRLMIGLGMAAALWAVWMLWRYRGGRNPEFRGFFRFSTMWITLFPLFGISFGWIFTEMGRQPWIVYGAQSTASAVSPLVAPWQVWTSMISFTLIYAVLAVFEVKLLLKYARAGVPEQVVADPYEDSKNDSDKQLYFAY